MDTYDKRCQLGASRRRLTNALPLSSGARRYAFVVRRGVSQGGSFQK